MSKKKEKNPEDIYDFDYSDDEKDTTPAQPENQVVKKCYRYVCSGCTKDAITTSNLMVDVRITCQHCKKEQLTKLSDYIEL